MALKSTKEWSKHDTVEAESLPDEFRLAPWKFLRSDAPRKVASQPSTRTKKFAVVGRTYVGQLLATSLPLVFGDLISLGAAITLSAVSLGSVTGELGINVLTTFSALSAALLLTNLFLGLYPGVCLTPFVELRQTSLAATLIFAVSPTALLAHSAGTSVTFWLLAWVLALIFIPWTRSLVRTIVQRFDWWGHPVLIFGGGLAAEAIYRGLDRRRNQGLRPIGVVDRLPTQWSDEELDPVLYLGNTGDAADICRKYSVFWGVVVMPERSRHEVNRVLLDDSAGIPHLLVSCDTPAPVALWARSHECGGKMCMHVKRRLLLPLPRFAKRAMDLSMAIAGGICILPIVCVLAALIKRSSPGPIFYSQERIGRDGRKFRAWKFRSMVSNADQVLKDYLAKHPELREEWDRDHKLKQDPRVTRIGRIIRATSLDELPQIWNVICGDMSLVGPRPIVQAEIAKYKDTYRHYERVTPGISGLWQVSGRNNTTYQERLAYDEYYVENWSPWMDLYILSRTVRVVLLREGAY